MKPPMTQPPPLDYQPMPPSPRLISDDIAYVLPMAVFLGFLWLQTKFPAHYALLYGLKTVATAAVLILLWNQFTKIRWNLWWLGLIVGVLGTFQWIGMQLWLQRHFAFFSPATDAFDPLEYFHNYNALLCFIGYRMLGAVLVVPFMEELFWRDYLWRQLLAPNDFKLASIGEWSPLALLIVSGAFATVHGNWWLTAIVWGLMVGGLLVYTKSLGACIIAHATTNLLLGLYVLKYHDWAFW